VLPALLSEAVLRVPLLLPHAARERTSSAESRKDMNFFILITPSVFWETPQNMGEFLEKR